MTIIWLIGIKFFLSSIELEEISKQEVLEEEEFDTDDENEAHDLTENKNYLALAIIKFRQLVFSILKQVKINKFNLSYFIFDFKKYAPKIILVLFILGFWVYFGFAMAINNPFIFAQKDGQNILQNWVFSHNRGLIDH